MITDAGACHNHRINEMTRRCLFCGESEQLIHSRARDPNRLVEPSVHLEDIQYWQNKYMYRNIL